MRRTQHIENLVEPLRTDDVAHTDVIELAGRDLHCHVTVRYLQDQVLNLFTFDGPYDDVFNPSCTVMWIDNGVANFKVQCSLPLSSVTSLTRAH
ncbi:hypothetical protein GCM10022231_05820 [Gordonia caeni]|uniref:Uncharacterized protein n=1 Tax=Gordonia caeni TaxID=1007097 RepID=A0ABP7NNP9_9ACTN